MTIRGLRRNDLPPGFVIPKVSKRRVFRSGPVSYHLSLNAMHSGQVEAWKIVEDPRASDPTLSAEERQAWADNAGGRFRAVRCGRRFGKCLAEGTRIAMADGSYKRVEQMAEGDLILNVNEDNCVIGVEPVARVLSNGVKETVWVETNARRLRCTPNHPLLTQRGWVDAGDLSTTDLIATPKRLAYGEQEEVPDHILDYFAIWLAEGRDYKISNTTPAILDVLHDAVTAWGMELGFLDGVDWVVRNVDGNARWRLNPAATWLRKQGLWGTDSKTKFIPDWVYRLPDHQLARFLNLFVACDGAITNPSKNTHALEIGLANESLVRQISELFLRFGIRGQVTAKTHNARSAKTGEPFQSWHFYACERDSMIRFCERIGALSKEEKVAKALANARRSRGSSQQYAPVGYEEIDALLPERRSAILHTIMRSWRKQRTDRISLRRLDQLRPFLPHGFDAVDADLAWEEVKAIIPAEPVATWDLALRENHNFIAEGIVTHNTAMGIIEAAEAAAAGQRVGWFAPGLKYLSEAYAELAGFLAPMLSAKNKDKFIRTLTGGVIEFWTLENEYAGRSRKYDLVIIDEAAFGPATMMATWEKSIKPTLFDRAGRALVISNTKGALPDNFFWRICNEPKFGFVCFHAPTEANPTIPEAWPPEAEIRVLGEHPEIALLWPHPRGNHPPPEYRQAIRDILRIEEIAKLKATEHPLVFAQEYGADFVDWSGDDFFDIGKLLLDDPYGAKDRDGNPQKIGHAVPQQCDQVFATIDTAAKTGSKNDGTAVCYWARNKYAGTKLILLDWDIVQIQGSLLEVWMEGVFENLANWSVRCGAREGSMGAWIEDKSTGIVLVQALQAKRLPAKPIPSDLTAKGKDERAIAASGHIYRGEMKMTQEAYDKRTPFKGQTLNHFVTQVSKFRIGVDGGAASDDILDCMTYSVIIALGNNAGY